ncbi:hypothetical protein Lumi_030 [Xylophilus phage Lumi]|nr:hypothetical protein Lumi_030 [Xylophilus phage Lumi]
MPFEKFVVVRPGLSGSAHKLVTNTRDASTGEKIVGIYTYFDRNEMEKPYPITTTNWEVRMSPAQVREALLAGNWDEDEALERWIIANVDKYMGATMIGAPTEEETLANSQAKALAALTADYVAAMKTLSGVYSNAEQKTWRAQVDEALAYTSDASAPTPWIDQAIAGNGRDKAEYAAAILGNNTMFTEESGRLTGILQGARGKIQEATDPAEVVAVTWNFSQPIQSTMIAPSPSPAVTPVAQ